MNFKNPQTILKMPKNAPKKQKMPKNDPNQLFLHDTILSISEEVKSIIVLVFAIYFKDVKIRPNLGPTCNLAVPHTLNSLDNLRTILPV